MEPSFQLAALFLLAGLFILVLELFVPSAGVLFVMSTLCFVASIVVAFMTSRALGFAFLIGEILLTPAVAWGGFQLWKRSPVGKRMFLEQQVADDEAESRAVASEDPANYRSLLGQIGKTITPLRPVGISDFAGRRVDTVAEGVMIDPGELVRVVEVHGSRIVVRRVEASEVEPAASLEPFEI